MKDGSKLKGMPVDGRFDGTADGTPKERESNGSPEGMVPDGS
jgi:hypothetical protein